MTTPVGPASSSAFGVVFQPDGNTVAAGVAYLNGTEDLALVRYDFNGGLDSSFGIGGIAQASVSALADRAVSIVRQADGKLVVGGYSEIPGDDVDYDPMLARFNPDGSLDPTFGVNGGVVTPLEDSDVDRFNDVLYLPDGKLLGVGSADGGTSLENSLLIQYDPDGSLDTLFGNGGKVITAVSSSFDGFLSAARQPDGKIVAGGWSNDPFSSDFALARYNDDGSLDTTFGTGGIVKTPFGDSMFGEVDAVAILPDGHIACAGRLIDGTQNNHASVVIARYDPNGVLDSSFGSGGIALTDLASSAFVSGLIRRSDGKLTVGGTRVDASIFASRSRMLLLQYNVDGSLDPGFGISGIVMESFYPGNSLASIGAITSTADGRIVAVGSAAETFSGQPRFAAARFFDDRCGALPADGCRAAAKSLLVLRNNPDDSKDALVWKWLKGAQTTLADFGVPTGTTNYALCLYAGSSAASVTIPSGPQWQAAGTTGYKFKDPSGAPDGAQKAVLKSGAASKAKALVRGKGGDLPDFPAPALALPVTVQLVNDAGVCFGAVYDTAEVLKNDMTQFKAKAR